MIKIEIKWYEDFVNKVWHLVVDWYANNAIRKSIINFERTAKIKTPVDTGDLRWSYESSFWNLEGELKNTRRYWLYVHEGTGRYARNWNGRKTPWFVQKANGDGFWTRWQKPQPWMEETVNQEVGKVEIFFNQEFEKLLSKLSS